MGIANRRGRPNIETSLFRAYPWIILLVEGIAPKSAAF